MTASAAARARFVREQAGPHAVMLRWQTGRRVVTALGCRACGVIGPSPAGGARQALDAFAQHVREAHAQLVEAVPWCTREPDPIGVVELGQLPARDDDPPHPS